MARIRDAMSLVRPHLLALDAYAAVDPPEVLAQRAGVPESEVVKLNGNENPYGPSAKVREALAGLDRVHIYPDPRQATLREAIGGYVGLSPAHIVAGNGSDELIDLLLVALLAPGDAIIDCTPTFDMYRFTAQVRGGTVLNLPRDDRFRVDVQAVLEAAQHAKAVFLASPNNPTGNATPLADIQRLVEAGQVVVVDEAYHEFGGESAATLVPDYANLIVLRTFSKWAGLAGLRVGYGLMASELAGLLLRTKPPYSVSHAAEAAVLASLDDMAVLQERVGWLVEERERMRGLLDGLPGVTPRPSDANFILCQTPEGKGAAVYEGLAGRGVFVRYFSDPRLSDLIRVSVGKPEHTDRLMEALAEVIEG